MLGKNASFKNSPESNICARELSALCNYALVLQLSFFSHYLLTHQSFDICIPCDSILLGLFRFYRENDSHFFFILKQGNSLISLSVPPIRK